MDSPPSHKYQHTRDHTTNQPNRPLFTLSVDALEKRLQPFYTTLTMTIRELEETVGAISSYAVFAEYHEQQYNTLADATREAIALLLAVTSQQHITPEWMARRDVLAARIRVTLNAYHQSIPGTTTGKGGTTPP